MTMRCSQCTFGCKQQPQERMNNNMFKNSPVGGHTAQHPVWAVLVHASCWARANATWMNALSTPALAALHVNGMDEGIPTAWAMPMQNPYSTAPAPAGHCWLLPLPQQRMPPGPRSPSRNPFCSFCSSSGKGVVIQVGPVIVVIPVQHVEQHARTGLRVHQQPLQRHDQGQARAQPPGHTRQAHGGTRPRRQHAGGSRL